MLVSRGVFPVPVKSGAGAEAHMYNLANAIADAGHEVHYVTNVSSEETGFHKNVVLHRIKSAKILASKSFYAWTISHTLGNIRAFKEASRLLREESHRFDLIHGHGNLSSLLLANVKRNIPLIYTVHDTPPYSCSYGSLKETIIHQTSFQCIDLGTWNRADHLISVSKNLKREIMKKGIPERKISAIYNGVEDEFLTERDREASRKVLRTKYGVTNDYCLYVGRLTYRKGLEYLLYALKRSPDIKCVIAGDGPQYDSLASLAETLGLRDRVFFTGFVPQEDIRDFYMAADFFVLPSLAEGFPLVILEALASGTPVIASGVAGIPEIVLNGHNGLIVPPADAEALTEALQKLAHDPGLRKEMSRNARHMVNEKYSWKSVAKEVLTVYDKVCA